MNSEKRQFVWRSGCLVHQLHEFKRFRLVLKGAVKLPVAKYSNCTYHRHSAHLTDTRLRVAALWNHPFGIISAKVCQSLLLYPNDQFSIWSSRPSAARWNSLFPASSNNLAQLSEEELLQLLPAKTKNCPREEAAVPHLDENLRRTVDKECIHRMFRQDFTVFMEFLRRYCATVDVAHHKNSSFLRYAMNKRCGAALEAPLPTIIEYLRLMNNAKIWFKFEGNKHNLAHAFDIHFHRLSWDEVNVFLEPLTVLGCVLVEDQIKKSLCRRLIDDFDAVDDVLLTRFFRLFYAQSFFPKNFLFITPWLLHICDALAAQTERFSLECLNCAGQLCAQMFIYDVRLLRAIAVTLQQQLRSQNLSPGQMIASVSVLAHFNFQLQPENSVYLEIVRTLEGEDMFSKFVNKPRSLMELLSSLSLVGVYSPKYLNCAFSDQFLRRLLGKKINPYRVTPELLTLHGGMTLECPDYVGTRLPPELFGVVLKKRTLELPKVLVKHTPIENVRSETMATCLNAPRNISTFNRVLFCTRGLLDELLGGVQYTHICYLLPQFKRATLIFCLDADGRPVQIPGKVRKAQIVGKQLLSSSQNWYAFVFKSHNIYTSNEPMLMGADIAKERQMRLCGLKVVSITQHGWLNTSIEDKLNILRNEISKVSGVELKMAEEPS